MGAFLFLGSWPIEKFTEYFALFWPQKPASKAAIPPKKNAVPAKNGNVDSDESDSSDSDSSLDDEPVSTTNAIYNFLEQWR